MKGPESRKLIMKISVTVKIHPLCTSGSERKFQMGPWGAVYVTSQGDSSFKILRESYAFYHKKTRRMASAKCSRAITGFSMSYGRGKYWLIYQKPGGQEKGRPFTTVGLKCCTAIPENAIFVQPTLTGLLF